VKLIIDNEEAIFLVQGEGYKMKKSWEQDPAAKAYSMEIRHF